MINRETLVNNIKESIATWDEDTVHVLVEFELRDVFSENNTSDGEPFDLAEFEDEALAKLKSIIEDIQSQKKKPNTAQSISKLSAYVSGQRVNELA